MILILFNSCLLIGLIGFLHFLKIQKRQLSFRILISLGLGIMYGVFLKWMDGNTAVVYVKDLLFFIGQGYLSLLKMLVIPLILTSILNTLLNLGSNSVVDIKKISFFTCALLLSLTATASLIGLAIGKLFGVGEGLSLPDLAVAPKHVYTNLVDTLLGMLPTNPIAIMTQENTIAIVLFAVLIGISARMVAAHEPEKIATFKRFVEGLFAIVKKLTTLVLQLTPFGIFALMALLLLNQGLALFVGMLNFIFAMYAAMAIMFIIHSLILFICGHTPWEYLKKAYPALLVAFTTRSSFGTLPVTEETLNKKFNINQAIATFAPSVGATIGMNACAGIFPAMLVVMTLTILHQPLTWDLILMVMFINAVASLGISGIPGTAYIAATVTLTSLHLPYAIVALVQGIDPIIDMGRTATNVNGVMTTALAVNRLISQPVKTTSYSLDSKEITADNIE